MNTISSSVLSPLLGQAVLILVFGFLRQSLQKQNEGSEIFEVPTMPTDSLCRVAFLRSLTNYREYSGASDLVPMHWQKPLLHPQTCLNLEVRVPSNTRL